jgi:hypothetical protein
VSDELRVRIPRSNLIGLVPLALATIPLAFTSPWLALLWLVPVVGIVHVFRTGVDVDAGGITRRTILGSRRIGWEQIEGLRLRRSRVAAQLVGGEVVRLPVLRPRHLSLLAAASGGHHPDPAQ